MAKKNVSVAPVVETKEETPVVVEVKKRGRKASETFDHKSGDVEVSIKPVLFNASELTREELETLATAKIRAIAYARFKTEMGRKLPAINVCKQAFESLKKQYPAMSDAEIQTIASIVNKDFCIAPPTEWSYSVEDFRTKPDEDESDES